MIIAVRRGEMVRVGRTAWADFSVPGDDDMADVHFTVQYDAQGIRVTDLNTAAGTLVNGEKVTDALLRTGDELSAGQTVFSVLVEGQPPPEAEPDQAAGPSTESAGDALASNASEPRFAADLCQHVELDEVAMALLGDQQPPDEFLEALVDAELFVDACKLLAIWLPKTDAVAWAGQCVREIFGESLTAKEEQALKAALDWASDPSEENRRAAGAAGEAVGHDHAAGVLGMAAFVSGGSLAPPDLAPVPPAEGLTARCIAAAIAMAAYHGNPAQAGARFRKFLESGRKLLTPPAGA